MQNSWLNYILVGLFIIFLSLFTALFITYQNVKTVDSLQGFLKNSNSFPTLAQIIQLEIKAHYPPQITQDPLKIAVANYVVNAVIQADSVETLTSYALPAAQKVAQTPTSILNNQVVFDTTSYKSQLTNDLTSLSLPPIVINTAQTVVQGVPDNLVLVDLNQHPNSVLAKIIRARTFIENLGKVVTFSEVIFGLIILGLIFINLRTLTRLLWSLVWGFVGTGVLLLVSNFLAPYILDLFSQPTSQVDLLYNNLGTGLIQYIFSLANKWALIYLILAGVSFLILKFAPVYRAQDWIDEKISPMDESKAVAKSNKGRKSSSKAAVR